MKAHCRTYHAKPEYKVLFSSQVLAVVDSGESLMRIARMYEERWQTGNGMVLRIVSGRTFEGYVFLQPD